MFNAKKFARNGLLAFTLLSVPVALAATDTATTTTETTPAPEQNRGFDDWGLLGLLGLFGLLGLRRNDRNVVVNGTRK